MKKITLILCAMLMVLGANANRVARVATANAEDAVTIIDMSAATYAAVYNMEGCIVDWYYENGNEDKKLPLPKGVMMLQIVEQKGNDINTLFMGYYAQENGSITEVNTMSELGCGIVVSTVKYNGQDLKLGEGTLIMSVLNEKYTKTVYRYDITVSAVGFNDKKDYAFTIQLPVTSIINNKIAETVTPDENGKYPASVYTVPTDKAFLWEEDKDDFDTYYAAGEFKFIEDYMNYEGMAKGLLLLEAENATTITRLQFILEKGSDLGALGIPVGTYPINWTDDVNTMSASVGIYQGDPYESYCQSYVQQSGQWLIKSRWYIVSGTAVVKEINGKLSLTIDALNGLKKKIHIVMGEKDNTALGETAVDANVDKTMVNGQLVIIRNGVRYNAQGVVIE